MWHPATEAVSDRAPARRPGTRRQQLRLRPVDLRRCVEVRRAIDGPEPICRRGPPVRSGCASSRVRPAGRRTAREATATVTWCGCRRGDSSRGTKASREMRAAKATGSSGAQAHRKRGEPQDRQRDATSPRLPGTANRRGGAKPRGRHLFRIGRSGTSRGGNTGVARSRECVDGGAYRRIPGEAASNVGFRSSSAGQDRAEASKRRRRPWRRGRSGDRSRVGRWEDLEGPIPGGARRRRKLTTAIRTERTAREDAGKANDPLPPPSSGVT
jgi:hypothetical protein